MPFQGLLQLQIKMGNREHSKNDEYRQILSEMKKDETKKVSINPQKKYLKLMKDTLSSAKLPPTLKKIIHQTLSDKVSDVELIETVTCINSLRNNELQSSFARSQSVLKERPESKFVRVNFGQGGFLKRMRNNFNFGQFSFSDGHEPSPNKSPTKAPKGTKSRLEDPDLENDRKQKLKVISQVMRKELNRIIHPFGKLNKAFAEYIQGNSQEFAPKKCQEQVYERNVQRLVSEWCMYLENSCMQPYKKWIMSYIELEEGKYGSWLRNLLMQEIWQVNNGYLFGMMVHVIHRCKLPLQIDMKELQESAALLTPSLFSIDPKLQIEGHFFDSIYEMSEIVTLLKPQRILAQLQTVKKRVCTDIDNYHRLVELGQVYQIDSDNILGIVGYILCKIASKIDEIHTHLIFLRVVYGEKVYFSMGLGSYMLSTVFGALQFLQSQHFRQLIAQKKPKKGKQALQKSGQGETKVGTTIPGQNSSIPESSSQMDKQQMHTNSLLQHL